MKRSSSWKLLCFFSACKNTARHQVTGQCATLVWCTDAAFSPVRVVLYLFSHLLGLLLHLLDDLVACAAIVAACRRAVLFPFLQADPAEIIFALRGERRNLKTGITDAIFSQCKCKEQTSVTEKTFYLRQTWKRQIFLDYLWNSLISCSF